MKSFFQRIHETGTRKPTSDDSNPTYQVSLPPSRPSNDKSRQRIPKKHAEATTSSANEPQVFGHVPHPLDDPSEHYTGRSGYNSATVPSTGRKSHSNTRNRTASIDPASQSHYPLDHVREKQNHNFPGNYMSASKRPPNSSPQHATASRTEDRFRIDKIEDSRLDDPRSQNMGSNRHGAALPNKAAQAENYPHRGRESEDRTNGRRQQERDRYREREREKERERDRYRDMERERDIEREKEWEREKEREQRRQRERVRRRTEDREKERESEAERNRERASKSTKEHRRAPDTVKTRPWNSERERDGFEGIYPKDNHDIVDRMQSRPRGLDTEGRELEKPGRHTEPEHGLPTIYGKPQSDSRHEKDRATDVVQKQEKGNRKRTESEGTRYRNYEGERNGQEKNGKDRNYREHVERNGRRYKDNNDYRDGSREPDSKRQNMPSSPAAPPPLHAVLQQAPASNIEIKYISDSLPQKHPPILSLTNRRRDNAEKGAILSTPTQHPNQVHQPPVYPHLAPSRLAQTSYQAGSDVNASVLLGHLPGKESTSTVSQTQRSQMDLVIPGIAVGDAEGTRRKDHHYRPRNSHMDTVIGLFSRAPSTEAAPNPQPVKNADDFSGNKGTLSAPLPEEPLQRPSQWPTIKKSVGGPSSSHVHDASVEPPQDADHVTFTTKATQPAGTRQSTNPRNPQVEIPAPRSHTIAKRHTNHYLPTTVSLPQPTSAHHYESQPVLIQPATPVDPTIAAPTVAGKYTQHSNIRSIPNDPSPTATPSSHTGPPAPKHTSKPLLEAQQLEGRIALTHHNETLPSNAYPGIPETLAEINDTSAKDSAQPGQESSRFHSTPKKDHPAFLPSIQPHEIVSTNQMTQLGSPNSVKFPVTHATLQLEVPAESLSEGLVKTHDRLPSTLEQIAPPANRRTSRVKPEPEGSAARPMIHSQSQLTYAPPLSNHASQSSYPSAADLALKPSAYGQDLKEASEIVGPPVASEQASHITATFDRKFLKVPLGMNSIVAKSTTGVRTGLVTSTVTAVQADSAPNSVPSSYQQASQSEIPGGPSMEPEAKAEPWSSRVPVSSSQTSAQGPTSYLDNKFHEKPEGMELKITTRTLAGAQDLYMAGQMAHTTRAAAPDVKQAQESHVTGLPNRGGLSNGSIMLTQTLVPENPSHLRSTLKDNLLAITPHFSSQPSHLMFPPNQPSITTHPKQLHEHLQQNYRKTRAEPSQTLTPSALIANHDSSSNPSPAAPKSVPRKEAGTVPHQSSLPPPLENSLKSIHAQTENLLPEPPVENIVHGTTPNQALAYNNHIRHTRPTHSHHKLVPSADFNGDTYIVQSLAGTNDPPHVHHEPTKLNTSAATTTLVDVRPQQLAAQSTTDISINRASALKGSGTHLTTERIDNQLESRSNLPPLTKVGRNQIDQRNPTISDFITDNDARSAAKNATPVLDPSVRIHRPSTAMGFHQTSGERTIPFSTGLSPSHAAPYPKFIRQFSDDSNAKLASSIRRPSTTLGSGHRRPDKIRSLDHPSFQPTSRPLDIPQQRVETMSRQTGTSAIDQEKTAPHSKRTHSYMLQVEANNRPVDKQQSHPKPFPEETSLFSSFAPEFPGTHAPTSTPTPSTTKENHVKSTTTLNFHPTSSKDLINTPLIASSDENRAEEQARAPKQAQSNSWHPPTKDRSLMVNKDSSDRQRVAPASQERQSSAQRAGHLDKLATPRNQTTNNSSRESQKPKEVDPLATELQGHHPPIQNSRLAELLSSPAPIKDLELRDYINASGATRLASVSLLTSQPFSSDLPVPAANLHAQPTNYVGKTRYSPAKSSRDVDVNLGTPDSPYATGLPQLQQNEILARNSSIAGESSKPTHPHTFIKPTNTQELSTLSRATQTSLLSAYNDKISIIPQTESPSGLYEASEPVVSYAPISSFPQATRIEHKKISSTQHFLPTISSSAYQHQLNNIPTQLITESDRQFQDEITRTRGNVTTTSTSIEAPLVSIGPMQQATASQPALTRPHLNVSIPSNSISLLPEAASTSRTYPNSHTLMRTTAATYNSEPFSDLIPQQRVPSSARNTALGHSLSHQHPEKLTRKQSKDSILLTPSDITPWMLKPTVSRTSIPASISSQTESRKRGLFNMFKSKTIPSSEEVPNPPTEPSYKEPKTSTDESQGKDKEREKISALSSRIKLPPPITVPISINQTPSRKSPNAKVFTPFRYLTSKRHRTVSAASIEAQDGTAANTVVGSPTASVHSSQPPPLHPPPLRDPFIATQEWRKQEAAEARQVSGGRLRRARPGVVFDVAEDPLEDRKRRPLRSKGPSRSS